jgi:hypothetical protein
MGGLIVLIGFAMLCTAAVAGLAGLIAPLWLRLLIMAAVYLVVGGALAAGFVKKLRNDIPPKMPQARHEARESMLALKEQVQRG